MKERTDPSGAESEGRSPEDAGLSVDEKFARLVAEVDGSRVERFGAKEEAAEDARSGRTKWSRLRRRRRPGEPDGPKPWETAGPAPAASQAQQDPDPWAATPRTGRERAKTSVKVLIALRRWSGSSGTPSSGRATIPRHR